MKRIKPSKKSKEVKETNIKSLSKEEKLTKITALKELIKSLKNEDPFYYYEPNDGCITAEKKAFLEKYLMPDDIPASLDSQLDVHKCASPIIAVTGGNQSSKTVSLVIEAYIQATGELPLSLKDIYPAEKLPSPYSGQIKNLRVVGVDYKQLMNTLLPAFIQWCPRKFLKNGSWSDSFSSQQGKLFLYKNKEIISNIEFMTNQQEVASFQGPPLHWLGYDEEPEEKIHEENLLRFATAEQLRIMFSFTPTSGMTWATDMLMKGIDRKGDNIADKISVFKLCSICNKKANMKVLEQILNEITDYNVLKMRLLGEVISLSGLVYGNCFSRQNIVEPFYEGLSKEKKKDYLCLAGIDPHSVTETAMVFVLIDREGNGYVDKCYFKARDTEEIRKDFWQIVSENEYRIGWSVCDKSADSSIIAFGGRNLYQELKMPIYDKIRSATLTKGIPALRTSEKFEGSIKAGVDTIKRRLKDGKLFVVDRPENKELVLSFKTLERDTYANEDKSGKKDRIKEGRHHLHAALRYIFQFPVNYYENRVNTPAPEMFDEMVCW